MTRFQVDSDQVAAAAQQVRGTIDRVQAEVAALMSGLDALQSSWTGPASTAFQSAAAQWRTTQQQVEASLASLDRSLATAAAHYADSELAAARLFG